MANEHQHYYISPPPHHAVGGAGYFTLKSDLSLLPPIFDRSLYLNNDVEEDRLCVAVDVGDRWDGGNLINTSCYLGKVIMQNRKMRLFSF